MRTRTAALLLCIALSGGCATSSNVPRSYERASWSRISLDQANAECENAVQAGLSESMYLCMKAKGYTER